MNKIEEIKENIIKLAKRRNWYTDTPQVYISGNDDMFIRIDPTNLLNRNMKYSNRQLLIFMGERIIEKYPEYKGIGIKLMMSAELIPNLKENNFKGVPIVEM